MFDLSSMLRLGAGLPAGAARSPQGSAQAPAGDAAAAAFGEALASLAELAGGVDGDASAASTDDGSVVDTLADADDSADIDDVDATAALLLTAVQPGVTPDWAVRSLPDGSVIDTAPASDDTAGETAEPRARIGRLVTADIARSPVTVAPESAASGSAGLTTPPLPAATAASAGSDTASISADEPAAAPAAAELAASADEAALTGSARRPVAASANAADTSDASAPARSRAAGTDAAAESSSRGESQRTLADVTRIVERLRAAVDNAARQEGAATSRASHATTAAPVAHLDTTAGTGSADARPIAPYMTGAPVASTAPLEPAARGTADFHDQTSGFGAAGHMQAARPVAPISAPTTASFASLVDVPAGTLPSDTASQIVQAVRLQFARGGGEAHIRLDPRQFGDMTVRVRVEDAVVIARVEADSPAVREWLQSHQHVLRQNLAGQQLTLDRLEVHEPPASSDGDASEREADRRDDEPQRRHRRRPETSELFDVVA